MKKLIFLSVTALSLLVWSNAAAEIVGLLQKEGKTLGYLNLDIDAMETLPVLSSSGILSMGGKVEYVDNELADKEAPTFSPLQGPSFESTFANISLDAENFGWVEGCYPQKTEDFSVLGEIFEKGLIVQYLGRDGSCREGGVYFWMYNPGKS